MAPTKNQQPKIERASALRRAQRSTAPPCSSQADHLYNSASSNSSASCCVSMSTDDSKQQDSSQDGCREYCTSQPAADALLEATNNKMGFMFLKIGESADYWLDSLPHSNKPLLDIGAAYGIHTVHAIKAGRDVIALDCDESHLTELRRRVEAIQSSSETSSSASLGIGKLCGTVLATLPSAAACSDESVSGVLMSEVLHFTRPGEPLLIFKDIFRWLEAGGRLVVTTASSTRLVHNVKVRGFKLHSGRSLDEALQLMTAPPDVLLDAAPGLLYFTKDYQFYDQTPKFMYYMGTRELDVLAKLAGFQVELVNYISPKKYPTFSSSNITDETVLLVARKPIDEGLQ